MNKHFLTAVFAALALGAIQATAQNQLQLAITGSCSTLDAQGHIVSTPISNQTLLQAAAVAGGISVSGLGLAYHIGGNALGDTIDVINRNTGATLTTLYGLYFGESFGRQALMSASHQQMKRIEYIYTTQNSHSLGSVLLTDYFILDSSGHTNTTYVLGQMQWLVTTDNTHPNTQVCSASFRTFQPWTFK
jgi:hypothetical protein